MDKPVDKLYHEGELAVQRRAKEGGIAQRVGRMVSQNIPAQMLRFIREQAMVVVGSIDPDGKVWASIVCGRPGFMQIPDAYTLIIDSPQPDVDNTDPVWSNLEQNPRTGLLIIGLETRRRLRINGRAKTVLAGRCVVDVERAYPNCPKYIQRRHWRVSTGDQLPTTGVKQTVCAAGTALTAAQKKLIANADTFFVASAHPEHGIDASHRGGPPGFACLIDEQTLRIADFVGNGMFNTLGNFFSYPQAGLVFMDFARGRTVQLSGRVAIQWDQDDPQGETGGTCRYWHFEITHWRENSLSFPLDWEFVDYSPFLPK